MSNLVTNGGFEQHVAGAPVGWTADGLATSEDSFGSYAGDRAGRLETLHLVLSIDPVTGDPVYGPWVRGTLTQAIQTLDGECYEITLRARRYSGNGKLYICVDDETVQTVERDGGWLASRAVIEATGSSFDLCFKSETADVACVWLVDAVEVVSMASKRREIRNALITALEGIDGTGSYETDVKKVYRYAQLPQQFPCIVVSDENETRELRGYQAVRGDLEFFIAAYVGGSQGEKKDSEIDDLVADIERAIAADVTLGLESYGVQAVVENVEVQRGLEDDTTCLAVMTVTTPYRFDRGTP